MECSRFKICLRLIKEKGIYDEFVKCSSSKKNFYKYKDSIRIFDYIVNWDDTKDGFWFWYLIQLEYLLLLISLKSNNYEEAIEYLNDLITVGFDNFYEDFFIGLRGKRPEMLKENVIDLLKAYNIDFSLINKIINNR